MTNLNFRRLATTFQSLEEVATHPVLLRLAHGLGHGSRGTQDVGRHPAYLNLRTSLAPERVAAYKVAGAGFTYNYAAKWVDSEVLAGLQTLANQLRLVEQLRLTAAGEMMNIGEGDRKQANKRWIIVIIRDLGSGHF